MTQTDILERFTRTIALIGQAAFERLQEAKVAVFGIGGVGAACAEALVRSGVGTVALIDHDLVTPSNINRQLIALHSTLGQEKAWACKQRLLDISPEAKILAYPFFYSESTQENLNMADFDAAADCMDTLSAKLLLAAKAPQNNCYLVSCMGAGNRLDPGKFRFADIYQTKVCPLAKRMRKACRDQEIPALRVLYSEEEPVKAETASQNGRHPPGSMAFVPPVAGMMIAGEIVRHLIARQVPDEEQSPALS